MKRFFSGLLVACFAMVAVESQAAVVAYWNFNSLNIPTASAPGSGGVPTTIAADQGTGSISLSGWTGLVDDFAGSTLNALNSDASGASLSLVSSTGNNSFIEISFSMAGLRDLAITFDTRGTSTGYDSGIWSYSTNGSTFFDFGAQTATRSTTFATTGPGVTASLNNASTAFLRYTLNGATTTGGNNRIDNLQLNATAVPEPSSLAVLGLIGAAGVVARRRRAKSEVAAE